MNILRRLPLSRLLLLCALVVAIGVSATALASAVGSGPTPAPKPLANAIHDSLAGPSLEGVSATIKLTDHLLEGANLASGGGGEASQLSASPLLSGASGRLWISKDGRVRLELQAEKGDTQIIYDGSTVTLYDAATNTLYRYKPPAKQGASATPPGSASPGAEHHEAPTVAKIEEGITHLRKHADVSEATATDVAGQPAYTVRVSPNEPGSLLGGAELSWDAVHGVPLRAAVYSSTSASPVIELAADEVSYGPVEDSVFSFTAPSNAKIVEVGGAGKGAPEPSGASGASAPSGGTSSHPHVTTHGHGVSTVAVLENTVAQGGKSSLNLPESLQKVKINGATASELPTALGTLLSFERSGVRYLLAGSVTPAAIEAVARGL